MSCPHPRNEYDASPCSICAHIRQLEERVAALLERAERAEARVRALAYRLEVTPP